MTQTFTRPQTTDLEHHAAVVFAQERLGRPLTLAERSIDLVGLDRDLAEAKQRLAHLLAVEMRQAVRRHVRSGLPVQMRFTEAMQAVVRRLYRDGQQHARNEIKTMTGIDVPSRQLVGSRDADDVEARLAQLIAQLNDKLIKAVHDIESSAVGNALVDDVGFEALPDIVTRQAFKVKGALDVASRIVSTGLFAGMGDIYDANSGLFDGWQYSAVMDAATCISCEQRDGAEYDSWEAAMFDMPGGGPNPECFGGGRCRCRLVPIIEGLPE